MTAQTLLSSLFHYKASIDEELLSALSGISGEVPELQTALRVFNHAHIVDRIFMAHLQGIAHPYQANWLAAPVLSQLSSDIRDTDRRYIDYISRVGPAELEEKIRFTFTDGDRGSMSREEMLAHVITHSGYHRGEIGRLLPQIEETGSRDVFAGYLHRSDGSRRE